MGFGEVADTFESILTKDGVILLDGGLATELEGYGLDLNHPLWSARALYENPDAILRTHLAYLKHGADIITTSSYQLSYPGCEASGFSRRETTELLNKSVEIASEARNTFSEENLGQRLIAASVGPFGAYLANGSEYTGKYDASDEELFEFHHDRWKIIAESDADLMICETIPNFREAMVLSKIVRKQTKPVIVSFACADGSTISDGTPVEDCAKIVFRFEICNSDWRKLHGA